MQGLGLYFRNYLGYSQRVKGLFIIMFIWEEGLFRNILKGRVLFAKMLKGGRVLE